MWLLDTSIWIATFQKRNPLDLQSLIDPDGIVTCLPVIQEVLQGFRDERAFQLARESLFNLPVVDNPMPAEVFEAAADVYRRVRRAGITPRSSIDCLIAASAIRHNLEILHRDRDYPAIAKVIALRQRAL